MRTRRPGMGGPPPPPVCPHCERTASSTGPVCTFHMEDWTRSFERRAWVRFGVTSGALYEQLAAYYCARVQGKLQKPMESLQERGGKLDGLAIPTERGVCATALREGASDFESGRTRCGLPHGFDDKTARSVRRAVTCLTCIAAWSWEEAGLGPWPMTG